MNIYIFILFGALCITGFTFTYIFAQRNNNNVNLSFLISVGLLEIWIGSDFLVATKILLPYNPVILKLFSFSWIFIGVAFLNFIYTYIERKNNFLILLLAVLAASIYITAVFTNLVYTGKDATEFGIIEKRGELYDYVSILMVAFPIIYAITIFFREFLKTDDSIRKKQMSVLISGAILSLVAGTFTDLILPRIMNGFMITASFSASILSIFVFWAVMRYRFLIIPLEETVYELFSSISNGIIILNGNNEIIRANPSAYKMLGIEKTFRNENIHSIIPQIDFHNVVNGREICRKKENGEEVYILVSVTPVDKPHLRTGKILILQDITELKKRTLELEQLNIAIMKASVTDMLTGLYNRQELYRRIDEEINRMQRHPQDTFSILFIDLDNFKYYNDTFGHPIGDIVLREFSNELKESIRVIDFVCRFGGDEFIILLTETDSNNAVYIAKRIQNGIKNKKHYINTIEENTGFHVKIPRNKLLGCSIGIAQYFPVLKGDADELIERADRALYKAKKARKGGYVIWKTEMGQSQKIIEDYA